MDAIKDLDSCDEAIACLGEAIEQQVHAQAQEVRSAVDQAERKLIQEVRTAVHQKRASIALQRGKAYRRNWLDWKVLFNLWNKVLSAL